jgi:hypothetical protein
VEKSLSHSAAERTEGECAEIVARIWRARYGANPDRPELLAAFRKGLPPDLRTEFWNLYREMRTRWSRGDMRQAAAVHRVQAAGALAGKDSKACLGELLAALREDPMWTLQALGVRFAGRSDFRT